MKITLITGYQIPLYKTYRKCVIYDNSKQWVKLSQNVNNFYHKIEFRFEEISDTFFKNKENKNIDYRYPEYLLHPSHQSQMIKDVIQWCQDNKSDIFISTHSDHIVNAVLVAIKQKTIYYKDVNILFFDETNTPVNVEISEFGNIQNRPNGFFDQIGKDLRILI